MLRLRHQGFVDCVHSGVTLESIRLWGIWWPTKIICNHQRKVFLSGLRRFLSSGITSHITGFSVPLWGLLCQHLRLRWAMDFCMVRVLYFSNRVTINEAGLFFKKLNIPFVASRHSLLQKCTLSFPLLPSSQSGWSTHSMVAENLMRQWDLLHLNYLKVCELCWISKSQLKAQTRKLKKKVKMKTHGRQQRSLWEILPFFFQFLFFLAAGQQWVP